MTTATWLPMREFLTSEPREVAEAILSKEPRAVGNDVDGWYARRLPNGQIELCEGDPRTKQATDGSAYYGNNVSNSNGESPVSNPALRRRMAANRSMQSTGRNGASHRPPNTQTQTLGVHLKATLRDSHSGSGGGGRLLRRGATSDATAAGVRAFNGAPFANTEAAVPLSPEVRSPRVRGHVRGTYWFEAESPELVGAIKAWARVWRQGVPEPWITSGRHAVLARRSKGAWRLVGEHPFVRYDSPEARARDLAPGPPRWQPGKVQASVLMRLKMFGAAETGQLGIPAKRAYKTLRSLEARELVVGSVTASGGFPNRRAILWSLLEPEEVAPIEAQEADGEIAAG